MRRSLEVRELAAWLEEGVGQAQMVGRFYSKEVQRCRWQLMEEIRLYLKYYLRPVLSKFSGRQSLCTELT